MARILLGVVWAVVLSSLSGTKAEISSGVVKLGVLTDESGVFSSLSGEGSVEATRMAVEDFGGKAAGKSIEIIHADHQNKTDIGAAIARRWFDNEGVDVIVDVPNSAIVLAVQQIAKDKNRVLLVSTAGTAELTGKRAHQLVCIGPGTPTPLPQAPPRRSCSGAAILGSS